ncbi:hypothetical protein ANCCEY_02687 [Ancylostoma ceylanicum]|uniref:aECM cysteine-cradle domain-containing protein n=1 Tax=Ancylostoma ceylanicum TaxID=53326 RepID=A0A0D6M277_9BILA|nr:hypothetical protein ANCCEY_02687 [Ancylostoma ceylanicum]
MSEFFVVSSNNSNELETRDNITQLARQVVATEQPSPEVLQKEKEELELARTLEWEQQKIQELKRERERIKQQKKEEIERIMKEQAIEQARIEAARAQPFLEREQLRAEIKEENRENSYRISSTRRIPKELEDKVAKRHRELLARFGNQALASTSNPTPEVAESSRIPGGGTGDENELQQENFNPPRAVSVSAPRGTSVSRYAEDNNVELRTSDVVEKYPAPIDFNTEQQSKKKRKTKRRKLRRKLHGIKTLRSNSVKSKQMKEPLMKKQNYIFTRKRMIMSIQQVKINTFFCNFEKKIQAKHKYKKYVKVFPTTATTPPSLKTLAVVVQPVLRQHNEASMAPPPSQVPQQRRKLKIQFGSNQGYSQTPRPYSTLDLSQQQAFAASVPAPPPNFGGGSVQVPMTNTGTLSRDQLDKICIDIQKTTRSFGIKDPKTFALNNCPLIKMYYRQVTCEQINHVMDYCERSSFLA